MADWDQAKRRVAATLARWAEEAPEEQERTVVVRPSSATSLDEAVRDLEAAAARVQDAGDAAITAVVTPPALRLAAALPWVVAVQAPRTFQPKR